MTPFFPPQGRKIFSDITAKYLFDTNAYVVDQTKVEYITHGFKGNIEYTVGCESPYFYANWKNQCFT